MHLRLTDSDPIIFFDNELTHCRQQTLQNGPHQPLSHIVMTPELQDTSNVSANQSLHTSHTPSMGKICILLHVNLDRTHYSESYRLSRSRYLQQRCYGDPSFILILSRVISRNSVLHGPFHVVPTECQHPATMETWKYKSDPRPIG